MVARKLPEILEAIIALEAGCVNQKSYLIVLRRIKYSDISYSHIVHKRKHTKVKMEKKKALYSIKMLSEVSYAFPDNKDFIEEKLEEKCSREKIPIEKVIHFFVVLPYR